MYAILSNTCRLSNQLNVQEAADGELGCVDVLGKSEARGGGGCLISPANGDDFARGCLHCLLREGLFCARHINDAIAFAGCT